MSEGAEPERWQDSHSWGTQALWCRQVWAPSSSANFHWCYQDFWTFSWPALPAPPAPVPTLFLWSLISSHTDPVQILKHTELLPVGLPRPGMCFPSLGLADFYSSARIHSFLRVSFPEPPVYVSLLLFSLPASCLCQEHAQAMCGYVLCENVAGSVPFSSAPWQAPSGQGPHLYSPAADLTAQGLGHSRLSMNICWVNEELKEVLNHSEVQAPQ